MYGRHLFSAIYVHTYSLISGTVSSIALVSAQERVGCLAPVSCQFIPHSENYFITVDEKTKQVIAQNCPRLQLQPHLHVCRAA